jgi:small subunit ribosomal protein S16
VYILSVENEWYFTGEEMVVIRLARFGSTHRPRYRVTVADSRRNRNGRFIEVLGHYNPSPKGQEQKLVLDVEKANDWIKKGAQPSDRVKSLIKQATSGAN